MTAHIAKLGDKTLFPKLEARAYWNHAGISPASEAVLRAAAAVGEDYAQRGAAAYPTWADQRARLRTKLATLVGASADEIAIEPNTTRGVIDVALCFPWNPGDRVVVFDGEFPSNVTPWKRAADAFDLEVVTLDGRDFARAGGAELGPLEAELKRGARLVAVSAVQFQTGLRVPLEAVSSLAHAHGAELFVDAVQACGATPIDVSQEGIDYLACGSHKWLMGLEGCGFLYANKERSPKLRPNVAGWLSHEDPVRFLFEGKGLVRYDAPLKTSAAMFEGGNVNAMGCAALEASLDCILSLGVGEIWRHANALHDRLEPALERRGLRSLRAKDAARRSCTLSFEPKSDDHLVKLGRGLAERGVACATPDGFLRFSPHWPSSANETEIIVAAIDEVLSA